MLIWMKIIRRYCISLGNVDSSIEDGWFDNSVKSALNKKIG